MKRRAVHTSVIWASRAARATPSRPRPLSLSRSHGCCSNRAPLVPTDRPASGDGEDTLPQEPTWFIGPECAPCRPPLRVQGGGACPTPPPHPPRLTLSLSLALALAPCPSSSPHPSPNAQGSNQVQGGARAARTRRPSSALPRGGASDPLTLAAHRTRAHLGAHPRFEPSPNPNPNP